MKRFALALLVAALACVPPAASSRAYYVSRPLQSFPSDSTVDRVVAYIDERTLIWSNALLIRGRRELLESGACLHVAERLGPDGFKLDSLFAPDSVRRQSLLEASIWCPAGSVPLHWHIVTEDIGALLQARGIPDALQLRCEVSDQDVAPVWANYPLNVMQCGLGVDSMFAYRVKPRASSARSGDSVMTPVIFQRRQVLVDPPSAPVVPTWPNLPAGYTQWFDVNWSVFTPTNWTWPFTSDSGDGTVAGSASLVSDATAPMDPPSVLQFSYPNGFTGGGYEPAKVVFDDPDTVSHLPMHLYVGWVFKISNPWQGHDSGVNKVFFVETATSPGNTTTDWFPVEVYGEGTNGVAPFRFRVSLFETNIAEPQNWCVANLDTTAISLGVWHKMELLMGFSTSTTSQDGTIDMWNDGVHVMSYSNINYPNAGFGEFQIAPTWGGSDTPYPTGAKTENDFFWFDHITGWIKRTL